MKCGNNDNLQKLVILIAINKIYEISVDCTLYNVHTIIDT